MVVSELSDNVGYERQDYAVLENRPTDIRIPIPDYYVLLPSIDPYFAR